MAPKLILKLLIKIVCWDGQNHSWEKNSLKEIQKEEEIIENYFLNIY